MRLGNEALNGGQRFLVQAQFIHGNRFGSGEHAHDDIFQAARRGNGRDPQFHLHRGKPAEVDLAVLGFAVLGNVQPAHDFNSGNHGVAELRRQLKIIYQRSVLAKAHARGLGSEVGLDMDVGGFLLDRVENHPVDQRHQHAVATGRLLLGDVLVAALRSHPGHQFLCAEFGVFGHSGPRPARLSAVDDGRAGRRDTRRGTVVALERTGDVRGGGGHRQNLHPGDPVQLLQNRVIHWILDRHDKRAFGFAQRHDAATVCDSRRDFGEYVEGDLGVDLGVEIDHGDAKPARQRAVNRLLVHDAHFLLQDLPDRHRPIQGVAPQRHIQFRPGHVSQFYQRFAQSLIWAIALEFQRRRKLVRRHDFVLREVLAQPLRAQHRLQVQRGFDRFRRNRLLIDQYLPDGRIDAAGFRRLCRHETADDIAVCVRKIQEQTAQRADVAQGHPQEHLAVHQFESERIAFRTPQFFGISCGRGRRQRFAPQHQGPRKQQLQQQRKTEY